MLAAGRSIDFAHDAAGREASRRIGGVITWTNAFDAAGRLTTRTVVAGARRQAIRRRLRLHTGTPSKAKRCSSQYRKSSSSPSKGLAVVWFQVSWCSSLSAAG